MSLAEGHVLGLLHDISVNDQYVGELCGEAQLDLSVAVKVEAHALRKFWNIRKNKFDRHKQIKMKPIAQTVESILKKIEEKHCLRLFPV